MADKFDFRVASTLIQVIEQSASTLDVKNGQMEKHFGNLHEGFKDAGYDAYATDMTAANKAIKEVIDQIHAVSKHIADYAQKLSEVE